MSIFSIKQKSIKRIPILLALLIGASSFASLFSQSFAFADSIDMGVLSATVTPEDQALSASYYVILGGCFWHTTTSFKVDSSNPEPSAWFKDDSAWLYGTKTTCNEIANKALALWGWNSDTKYADFLKAMGCSYNGTDKYTCASSSDGRNSAVKAAILKKAYPTADPSNTDDDAVPLSDAGKYIRNLKIFNTACSGSDIGTVDEINAASEQTNANRINNNYYSTDSQGTTTVYSTGYMVSSNVVVNHGLTYKTTLTDALGEIPQSSWTTISGNNFSSSGYKETAINTLGHGSSQADRASDRKTCTQLVQGLTSEYAAAYAWYNQKNGRTSDTTIALSQSTTTDSSTTSCGDQVSGVGWIVCPIVSALGSLNDSVWQLVQKMLVVNPLSSNTSSTNSIYTAWAILRNIANALFIIAFLIVIFSQITGYGIDNYGVKKMLPKLAIGIIIINLSYLMMQVLVDVFNITGNSLYTVLASLAPKAAFSTTTLVNLIIGAISGTAIAALGITIVGGAGAVFLLLLPALAAMALALLAAFLTLLVRQAAIPILVILAPVAILASALPNTKSWFEKWKKILIDMLMLYPLAAVIFGGALFAGQAIMSMNPNGWFEVMTGMIVMVLPLASLPWLAAKGGDITGAIMNKAQSLGSDAKKALSGYTKPLADTARTRSEMRSLNSNMRFNPRRRMLQRRLEKDAILKNTQSGLQRSGAGYIADQIGSNQRFVDKMVSGAGEGAETRVAASAISTKNALRDKELDAERVLNKGRTVDTAVADALNQSKSSVQKQVALEQVLESGSFPQREAMYRAANTFDGDAKAAMNAKYFSKRDNQFFGAGFGSKVLEGKDVDLEADMKARLREKVSPLMLTEDIDATRQMKQLAQNMDDTVKASIGLAARDAFKLPNTAEKITKEMAAELNEMAAWAPPSAGSDNN